jgi:hypothetical protein
MLFGLGSMAKAQPDTYQYQNGYCPICGTLAPPYIRRRGTHIVPCVNPTISSDICTEFDVPYDPLTQQVVCSKCKVVFVQEASGVQQ